MRVALDAAPSGTVVPFPARRPGDRDHPAPVPRASSGETWIYRPCRNALQGGARTRPWVLDFVPAEPERPDILTGWTGSGDTRKQIRLEFPRLREALRFAARRGWNVTVMEAREPRRIQPRPTWLSGSPPARKEAPRRPDRPSTGQGTETRPTGCGGSQLLRVS